MRRPALVLALVALAAAPGAAGAAVTAVPPPAADREEIAPGVTYERLVDDGPQIVHVVRVRPGPRRTLATVLVEGTTSRRGSLAGAVAARQDSGATAGLNADLFNTRLSYPSGLLLTGGELVSEPEGGRSSVAIRPDGRLVVGLLSFAGQFQAVDPAGARAYGPRRIDGINRFPERGSETLLYTAGFGGPTTPAGASRFEARVRLDEVRPVRPNEARGGTVVETGAGGGRGLGADHVVVTGIGAAGRTVASDLPLGQRVVVQPQVLGLEPDVAEASGGGPVLVRDGVAVTDAGEAFSSAQLLSRTNRSGLGQAADGTYLLVAAEGPQQGSRGMTVAEQAGSLAGLGAVTAIGMDGGGSSQLAVRDRLVTPWGAYPRAVTTAFVARYAGVRLDPLPVRLSPNADRVDDAAGTVVRATAQGEVRVTAVRRRGGRTARLAQQPLGPGALAVTIDGRAQGLPDGVYDIVARHLPGDGSGATVHRRRVIVDRTLSHLVARPSARGRGAARRPRLDVRFRLLRPARVTVDVRADDGRVIRTLAGGVRLRPGRHAVTWDRVARGRVISGEVTVRVTAVGRLGRTGLERPVKLSPPPPPPDERAARPG